MLCPAQSLAPSFPQAVIRWWSNDISKAFRRVGKKFAFRPRHTLSTDRDGSYFRNVLGFVLFGWHPHVGKRLMDGLAGNTLHGLGWFDSLVHDYIATRQN